MQKFTKLVVTFMMVFYMLSSPLSVLANSSEPINKEEVIKKNAVIQVETEELIPLYDSLDVKNVLLQLYDGLEVTVLEQDDDYSFIEVTIEAEQLLENNDALSIGDVIQGYVETKYVLITEIEKAPTDEETNESSKKIAGDNKSANLASEAQVTEEPQMFTTFSAPSTTLQAQSATTASTKKVEHYRGVAKKSPTNVRQSASTKAKIIKQYPIGTVLNYESYSTDWYRIKVSNNVYGYIHKKHVTTVKTKPVDVRGVAKKKTTNIRVGASTKSKVLRKVPIGQVLNMKTFSKNWYQVNIGGQVGYIHRKHVTVVKTKPEPVKGVAKKTTTNIRVGASTKSNVLRKVPVGYVMTNMKTFSKNWYEVNIGGQVGYIHRKHVTIVKTKPVNTRVYTLKSPTNVRVGASTKSNVLTKIPKGTLIDVTTFSKNWYSYTATINGKRQTGYIHRKHVGSTIRTNYNLALTEALNIQMKVSPLTDKKYGWVAKQYINSQNKVTASTLNVRYAPNENSSILGKLSNGATVTIRDEYNGWYLIDFNHSAQWVHAGPKEVLYYLNPAHFINDEKQMFQFLDLSKPSGATAAQLNKYLQGKGTLTNQGQAFIDAGKRHGINEVYLISHAILETGHGKSNLASGKIKVGEITKNKKYVVQLPNGRIYIVENGKATRNDNYNLKGITMRSIYNMFGINAYDSNPDVFGAERAYREGWFSPRAAILGGAAFIGNGYINAGQNTLYKMRWNPQAMAANKKASHQYATDIAWAYKQVGRIYDLYKEIGITTSYFDIPVYK